jgi:hypothetical protein
MRLTALAAATAVILTHFRNALGATIDFIQTDEDCYTFIDATISITFTNAEPKPEDWIGIYEKNTYADNLPESLLHLWACGSQRCRGLVSMANLTFGAGPPVVNHIMQCIPCFPRIPTGRIL